MRRGALVLGLLWAGCDPLYSPFDTLNPAREVLIPGGSFWMGTRPMDVDPTDQNDYTINETWETPPFPVTVSSFYLDRTEVTAADYDQCVLARRCAPVMMTRAMNLLCNSQQAGYETHPINCVSWEDAKAYCEQRPQRGRLPTEIEWEYAARGGPSQPDDQGPLFPSGSQPTSGNDCIARSETCPVTLDQSHWTLFGQKRPDGLADLAGNVWEWTANEVCSYPLTDPHPDCSHPPPQHGNCVPPFHVARGGSWADPPPFKTLRATARLLAPNNCGVDDALGFRCARDAP